MRILGVRVWPEKSTDEEYVEHIRKSVRSYSRWLRYSLGALGVLTLMVAIYGFIVFHKPLKVESLDDSEQSLVYSAFGLAIMGGLFVGLVLHNAATCFAEALTRNRKEKLLLDCWDALHPKNDTPK